MADRSLLPTVQFLRPWRRSFLIGALTLLVAIAALPYYLQGGWPWGAMLEVPNIQQLQALQDNPLSIEGWQLQGNESVTIGRVRWQLAEYQPESPTDPPVAAAVVLLRPQVWHLNQPQVEWVDIRGSQGWRVQNDHTLTFTVPGPNGHTATVTAQYFRGISSQRTFAVMQWYGWPEGGHLAPGRWFWLDQKRQWQRRQRQPWVAVSIMLPIEPVGDIQRYEAVAKAVGTQVQQALMAGPFDGMF